MMIVPVIPGALPAADDKAEAEKSVLAEGKAEIKRKKKRIIKKAEKITSGYSRKSDPVEKKSGMAESGMNVDASSLRQAADDDTKNVLVLLAEIPVKMNDFTLAPIYMTEQKKIFGSGTDLYLDWLGYKLKAKFVQPKFPFKKTEIQETFIGSFLYASGTNLGFIDNTYRDEVRFYTNYTSQILTLKWNMARYLKTGYSLDSRQYFFVKRELPDEFVMPENHINIFPNFIIEAGETTVAGMDMITRGIKLSGWGGYGLRNRWSWWGEPGNPQSGGYAGDFWIYSAEISSGALIHENHNIYMKLKYKGGIDNDFISMPRFGGTINNINLDLAHGFTLDYFRVYEFGLANFHWGSNISKRVRLNLYLDYARILSPRAENIIGSGYGIRVLLFKGLPVWITHGIGREIDRQGSPFSHTIMTMAAAGW